MKMKYLLCCLSLWGSVALSDQKIDKVVMVVNDTAITQYDFDLFYQVTMAMTPEQYREQTANDLRQHQANLMVDQALMVALAENEHLDVTEEMIDDLQANIQSRMGLDDDGFINHLKTFSLTEDQFREHLQKGLAASLIQQKVVKSLVKISPPMVEAYIKQKQAKGTRYVFNDYRIKADGLSDQAQAKMADTLAKEIKANSRIPEKIKPHVERTPFVDVSKDKIPQAFYKQITNAKPAEVIKAFKIANGYHVIWYKDKKQPAPITQQQAAVEIGEPKAEAAFANWMKALRESAYVHQFV